MMQSATMTIYDTASGRILRTVTCPATMVDAQVGDGEAYLEGRFNDTLEYVLDGAVVPRPDQDTALSNTQVIAGGTDFGVLSNLPQPCTVFIEKTAYEVPDGILEFSLPFPGQYPLRVTNCFPYLDKEFTVEGIAQV